MSPPIVRQAGPGDLDIIYENNLAMAKESENLELPKDVARAGVAAVLDGKVSATFFVVEIESRVVGQLMITYEWSDWRAKNIWWIQSVYVHPDYRKRGYFRMLYDHVKKACADAGGCGLRLYADNENLKAQAAYEKLGMITHYKVYEDLSTPY